LPQDRHLGQQEHKPEIDHPDRCLTLRYPRQDVLNGPNVERGNEEEKPQDVTAQRFHRHIQPVIPRLDKQRDWSDPAAQRLNNGGNAIEVCLVGWPVISGLVSKASQQRYYGSRYAPSPPRRAPYFNRSECKQYGD